MQGARHHPGSQGLLWPLPSEDRAVSEPLPEAQPAGGPPRLSATLGGALISEQPHPAEAKQRGIQLLL